MNEKSEEKLKDIIKFIIALFFVILVILLNLGYWAFIVVLMKWIVTIFIPDVTWETIAFSVAIYYILRKISAKIVRVVKRK